MQYQESSIHRLRFTVSMTWIDLSGKSAHLGVNRACLHTHAHTFIIHKHLWDAKGSSGFQCVLWKVLTLANISWCVLFICILGAASAGSYCQSFLFECQHYYYSRWCNSRCLSACLSRILCLSFCVFCASLSVSPAFLPSVLFNSYHYVSAKWNPLGIHFFYPLQASLFF